MVGRHGVASVDDIVFCLAKLRIQIPMQDIDDALVELIAHDLVERLGDETYRLGNDLVRRWLKKNRDALDTVRQTQTYRRARLRRISPLKNKRIDWASLVLWLLAGVIALLILFVWRSRQTHITWTVEPTAVIATKPVAQETPAVVLPTVEKGVAPGHIVYIGKEAASSMWEIYVMRSDGSDPVQLTDNQAKDTSPVWAIDGRHIAFVSDRDGNREVYVMNADGNEQLNLTAHPAEDWTPAWSPDGQRIAFSSFRDGNWEIYVMNADGSDPERLTQNRALDYGPSWSPAGHRIAFVSDRDGNLEIYIMDVAGGQPTRFTDDPATDQDPAWSPDGTQIAWASYRDDNMEIYIANVDGSEMRNVSRDAYADDHGPVWSPWGTHVAHFSNRDGGWDIYTLDLETGERDNLTSSALLEQSPHWGP
jgi:TolB protein